MEDEENIPLVGAVDPKEYDLQRKNRNNKVQSGSEQYDLCCLPYEIYAECLRCSICVRDNE